MKTAKLDKHCYNLSEVAKHLHELHKDDATVEQLMKSYCLSSSSAVIQRTGLEFLYVNEYFLELQELIDINEVRPEIENQQWAIVYQVLINLEYKNEEPEISLVRINKIQTDSLELLMIIEFAKVALYYAINENWQIGNFLEKYNELFQHIHDPMMRSLLKLRLNEGLFRYHWKRNEVIIARKHAYKVLNVASKPLRRIRIHRNLGISYLFETYEQGMFHLNKAVEIAKEHNKTTQLKELYNHYIPFFTVHFNKSEGLQPEDKSGKVLVHLSKGETEKAIHLLKQCSLDNPFNLYFMGLATGEERYLNQSYEIFMIERGNVFFARLLIEAMRALE